MLILGEFSRHNLINMHQTAPYFQNFLEYHMPPSFKHTCICVQLYYNYFYMKIAFLFSKFFQNIHQNASIVTCFQNFLHEKYPIASKKNFFFIYKMTIFKKI